MARIIEEEEFEHSEKIESAIAAYYPSWMTPKDPMFMPRQWELSLAMLEAHRAIMSPSDRRRALATVQELKSNLANWRPRNAAQNSSK